jgi:hypothetical protein
MTTTKRLMLAGALTSLAALAPVTISFDQGMRVVRLNQACGQATECLAATSFICSTHNGDHIGYRCSKGCDNQTE